MTGSHARGLATAALLTCTALAGTAAANPLTTIESPPVPVHGSVRIERIRAADPDGGASWGVRTFRTTDGSRCAQTGRIVGGRLGTIDEHGRFARAKFVREYCSLPGTGMPASYGLGSTATNSPPNCTFASGPHAPVGVPMCPPRGERTVFGGLFGSDLVAARFADAHGAHAHRLAVGKDGTFIAVIRGGVARLAAPRITLTFDSGCTKQARRRLSILGAFRRGCKVIVPDLYAPLRKAPPPLTPSS